MKNILTLLCILAFGQAAFAGGTLIYTSPAPNGSTVQNSTQYTQNGKPAKKGLFRRNKGQQTVVEEGSYEKNYHAGAPSTYRTQQDKYFNHGGVKFGSGFSNNGTTGRW